MKMEKEQKIKKRISSSEVMVRIFIILAVSGLAYFTRDSDKQIIGTSALFITLVACCILYKHFAPFVIIATFLFLCASLQQFWNEEYTYLPITKALWVAGCISLPIGIADFWYRITHKYKIINK